MYEGVEYGNTGVMASNTADYDQYIKNNAGHTGEDWDEGHGVNNTFKDYIFKTVLKDHIAALYRSQKRAAVEAGFDKLYQSKVGAALEANDPDLLRNVVGATVWSAMYLDTAKDMSVATNAEELAEQMHNIEMLNDRTPAQRNYLAQKVQTRYWMQQAVNMGESTDLLHMLNGRDFNSGDPYGMKKYTSTATAQYTEFTKWSIGEGESARVAIHYWDKGDNMASEIAFQHLDTVPGFAMPWQNAGESWLPTLTGTLEGTSAKDYMDDYRSKAYDRLSQEAIVNTTQWINATGKLDPNMLLEGIDYKLQDGGLYHDPDIHDTEMAYDEYLRDYVRPGGNSKKWTEYDPETGDYVLTDEGRRQKIWEDGMDDLHKWEEEQKNTKIEKTKEYLSKGGTLSTGLQGDETPEETLKKLAETETEEDKGKEDFTDTMEQHSEQAGTYESGGQYQGYDLPAGWHWQQAFGADAQVYTGGIYVSPDGKQFGDAGRGPQGIDQDETRQMYYEDYVEILEEAQKRADEEKAREEKDVARKAKEAADLERYRNILLRRRAEHADAKVRRGEKYLASQRAGDDDDDDEPEYEGRTKSDIARQIAEFTQDDIEQWRKQGVSLGVLDDDFQPIVERPTASTSHVPDPVVPTHNHVESVAMQHSVDHEEFNVPPMSSAFIAAIAHFERS